MATTKIISTRDLVRETQEAQARAAGVGLTDTSHALAGIAAMIATLEAEAQEAENQTEKPSASADGEGRTAK